MKFYVQVYLLVACFSLGYSQNLVTNFSFEDHKFCPISPGHIIDAEPWKRVNGQTSDYFHPCGDPSCCTAPNNKVSFGYQVASDGVAYAGIRVWDDDWGPLIREYIGVSLTSSLVACKAYFVSFKVSLAEGMQTKWATDDIGLYFSNTIIDYNDPNGVLNYKPQVRNPEGNILLDTAGWMTISGLYIAKGGESYIVIGNFESYQNTTVVDVNPAKNDGTSYYYIDEVVVEELKGNPVELGNDTLICEGEKVLLQTNDIYNTLYTWQDGSTSNNYVVSAQGIYSVKMESQGCFFYDTIKINTQVKPQINLGGNKSACFGEKVLLKTETQGNHYWSTGSTLDSISVETSGLYSVKVDTGVCIIHDDVYVDIHDCVFVPSAFSPNGDGQNDLFIVRGASPSKFQIQVYNRWGQKVYHSSDPLKGWDGKFEGVELNTGVYFYLIETLSPLTGEAYRLNGNLTLMR